MDSGQFVPAKHVEPGLDSLRADDGGEQDPVISPSFAHPAFSPGRNIWCAGEQTRVAGGEDRPPAGAVHMRGRLALEVLLDKVDEEVNGGRGGAFEIPLELGVSRLVRGEFRGRPEGSAAIPGTGAPRSPGPSRPSVRSF